MIRAWTGSQPVDIQTQLHGTLIKYHSKQKVQDRRRVEPSGSLIFNTHKGTALVKIFDYVKHLLKWQTKRSRTFLACNRHEIEMEAGVSEPRGG